MATEVSINDLSTWLSNQPDNTVDTPYEIKITNITSSDHSTLHSALYNNPTKYVDLSETQLSFVLMGLFEQCSSLVESPKLPNSVTSNKDIQSMYYKCTSLRKAPRIPEGVTGMYQCFALCTSLTETPPLPETVTDLEVAFSRCSLLGYKPIIPNSVTSSRNCYYGVTTNNWTGTQSQAESFLSTFFSQTTDSELQIYNNDRVTYDHSIYNIDISNLSTAYDFVSGLAQNTPETAYKIYLRGLTSSNAENITIVFGYIYIQTPNKFYDFGYTTIPQGTSLTNLFWRSDGYYMYSCSSMVTAPVLPTDQTSMTRTFSYCFALKNVTIPNGITDLSGTFGDCASLEEPPAIPSSVTSMEFTFSRSALKEAPVLPSGLTNMEGTFEGCISLTDAPLIPNSVTALSDCFEGCTNITEIKSIPSGITGAVSAFEGCTSLRKIDEFHIPLNTLKNNPDFQDMFAGCTSLTQIGFKIDTDTWHAWRLKFDANSVEGKIFGFNNGQLTSTAVLNTQISKNDIRLPVLTDELWFPPANMSDSDVEDVIRSVLNNRYTYWNKAVIDPNSKSLVMMASDPNNVVSNFLNGGGGGGVEKLVISTTRSVNVTKDTRIFADGSAITITLNYGSSAEGYVAEVYAIQACTITYYTAQGTTTSLAMEAGGKAIFVYFSGWKLHSNYGTTNSVTVDNMQSVSSNAVAQALGNRRFKLITDTFTINSGYISLNPQMENTDYYAFVQSRYNGSGSTQNLIYTVQEYQANILYIYVRDGNGNAPANGTQVRLNILIMY